LTVDPYSFLIALTSSSASWQNANRRCDLRARYVRMIGVG
jgi:DNA topoisomerase VI subunit A